MQLGSAYWTAAVGEAGRVCRGCRGSRSGAAGGTHAELARVHGTMCMEGVGTRSGLNARLQAPPQRRHSWHPGTWNAPGLALSSAIFACTWLSSVILNRKMASAGSACAFGAAAVDASPLAAGAPTVMVWYSPCRLTSCRPGTTDLMA